MKFSGTIGLFNIAFFPIKVTTKFPRIASDFSEISLIDDNSNRVFTIPLETNGPEFSNTVERLCKAHRHACLVSRLEFDSRISLSKGRKSKEGRENWVFARDDNDKSNSAN